MSRNELNETQESNLYDYIIKYESIKAKSEELQIELDVMKEKLKTTIKKYGSLGHSSKDSTTNYELKCNDKKLVCGIYKFLRFDSTSVPEEIKLQYRKELVTERLYVKAGPSVKMNIDSKLDF